MRIVLKAKDPHDFRRAVANVQKTLVGEQNGETWVYKTDKGTYTFYTGGLVSEGFAQFEGKRRSFGRSMYFKVRRVKKIFGKDKLRMLIGKKEFDMRVTHFESSAKNKPFWANCSKDEYRALQKLKAY